MSFNKIKKDVSLRAKYLCEYCKSPANISSQPFAVEHIIPKSKGGETVLDNLALSCQGCNNYKYTKTEGIDLLTNNKVSLFNPRKHEWNKNFAWSDDLLEVLGITSIGRISVNILKLNRLELKNLRKLLANAGKHPPL